MIMPTLWTFAERPLDWVRAKTKPRQFADNKNRPGKDYPTKKDKPDVPSTGA